MNAINQLLKNRIGMEPASVGASAIERAVRQGMQSLGIPSESDYYSLLECGGKEWEDFIELIVVRETWFFRDRHPFISLVKFARESWLPAHPSGVLRILSLPCSTGEEPYSAAMALLEDGLDPARFTIDAVDLSSQALDAARRGIYRKHSFRCANSLALRKYFQESREGHEIAARIRQTVSFQRANILDEAFWHAPRPYEIIFCRNLLIYCDEPSRAKVLGQLAKMLAPNGFLFVGAAEGSLVQSHGFISANIPMSFAYQLPPSREDCPAPRVEKRLGIPSARSFSLERRAPASSPGARFPIEHCDTDLLKAKDLANAGFLDEAGRICQRHLQVQGASAEAFYLLGLLNEAKGESGAADCYRKTLYLDPTHYLALLQMSSLALKGGDEERARSFRVRAERVRPAGLET